MLLEASDRYLITSRNEHNNNLRISGEIRQLLSNMFGNSNNFDRHLGLAGHIADFNQTDEIQGAEVSSMIYSGVHTIFGTDQLFAESKSKEIVIQTSNGYSESNVLEEDDIEEF